ncbi:hypothetical protein ACFWP5_38360 [Streptomyces sp. NPDC058469]|uniref:hypothetical protein n=1 Tax=Streptomyces sp. NPDC058469 TaxID=3346514 RepID=UPI00365F065B
MRADEPTVEVFSRAGTLAVVAVLTPVLTGAAALIFLLVGYAVKLLDPEPAFAKNMLTLGWAAGAVTAVAILGSAIALLLTSLRTRPPEQDLDPEATTSTHTQNARAGLRTLDLASFVAGERRSHLREEWASVLAGDPGNGITLSRRRRLRYALGFLWAALRMRLRDLTAPLWLPVDWLLSVETRTHGFITLAVGAQVVYVECEDGFHALVTEGWGWCAGCGIALRLFVGWLRRIRGIELASAHSDSNDI